MFNNPYTNTYQQLASLQNQLQGAQQPYTVPQMGLQQGATQQIPNVQLLIQQEVQRQIANMQLQQPAMPMQPQVPPGVAIMQAVGNQMTINDQRWLSANLGDLPSFLGTQEGREVIHLALDGFRKYMGVEQ